MNDGSPSAGPPRAPLFYLMGPSGAGKDSVIAALRERVGDGELLLPRRVITRAADAGGEHHESVSAAAFAAREAAGDFLFAWRSHGRRYGIGREVGAALAAGIPALVNGSRAYLPQARERAPTLVPVALDAPPAVLRQRLRRRGREDGAEIRARLERAIALQAALPADTRMIPADGPLEETVRRVLDLVRALRVSQRG